jgi:hypothetical protein
MKNHTTLVVKSAGKLFAFIFFLSVSAISGFSQNAIISTTFLQMPDSATSGSTDTVSVTIKNIDNASYTGYINIYYTTDTVTFSPLLLCSIPSVSLSSGDTISTSCTINFDSTYFQTGNRIVVVWSSGNGKFASDSLWDSVYISPQVAGIHEYDMNASFTIFPSPAKDVITIKTNKTTLSKDLIQSIKMTDVFGRTIYTEPFLGENQKINVTQLPPGIYFLELMDKDRKRATQKFVRAN